jgi:O-methyltransferase
MAIEPHQVKAFRRRAALDAVFFVNPPTIEIDDRLALHEKAGEWLGRDDPVTYLEFGVAGGNSLRRAVARFTHSDTRLFGFDSFEGLPEDWLVGARLERSIPKGTFSQRGRVPVLGDTRVELVNGWFQNTVPEFLSAHRDLLVNRKIMIHFDADLYSSTLFLLTTIWHHIPEFHFIMDDFIHDEAIALHDFMLAYPVELSWLAAHNQGEQPTQVFGKIRRMPFMQPG